MAFPNIGNTCYANSILSMLMASNTFHSFLSDTSNHFHSCPQYIRYLQQWSTQSRKSSKPKRTPNEDDMVSFFQEISTTMETYGIEWQEQNDSLDFLHALFTKIHEDTSSIQCRRLSHQPEREDRTKLKMEPYHWFSSSLPHVEYFRLRLLELSLNQPYAWSDIERLHQSKRATHIQRKNTRARKLIDSYFHQTPSLQTIYSNPWKSKPYLQEHPITFYTNHSLLQDLIEIKVYEQIVCPHCLGYTEMFSSQSYIMLEPTKKTIREAFNHWLSDEYVELYTCTQCSTTSNARIFRFLLNQPSLLLLVFRRFQQRRNGSFQKNKSSIQLSKSLRIQSKLFPCPPYKLCSFTNHHGTLQYGHYTSICRYHVQRQKKNEMIEQWFLIDDDTVQPCLKQDTLFQLPQPDVYCVLYEKE